MMESIWNLFEWAKEALGGMAVFVVLFVCIVAVLAQWRLYEKAGQPGLAALVPIWNFIVFLKIVGRPPRHLWLFLIPIYGQFYMLPKVWIECVQSFGKRTTLDYVLVVLLNGLYILNLGLSYSTRYVGPVYGRPPLRKPTKLTARPQLA